MEEQTDVIELLLETFPELTLSPVQRQLMKMFAVEINKDRLMSPLPPPASIPFPWGWQAPFGGHYIPYASPAARSITCPQCGCQSWHPEDVHHHYCSRCHEYHHNMRKRPTPPEGWQGRWRQDSYFWAGDDPPVVDSPVSLTFTASCPHGCCDLSGGIHVIRLGSIDTEAQKRDYEDRSWLDINARLANGSHVCLGAEQRRRRSHINSPSIQRWRAEGLMPHNEALGATLVWKHVRILGGAYLDERSISIERFSGFLYQGGEIVIPDATNGPVFLGNLGAPYELGVPFRFPEGMACAGPAGALKGWLAGDNYPYVMAVWCTVLDDRQGLFTASSKESGVFHARAGIPAAIYRATPDHRNPGEFYMKLVIGEDVLPLLSDVELVATSTANVPSDYRQASPKSAVPATDTQVSPKLSRLLRQTPRHGKRNTKRRY